MSVTCLMISNVMIGNKLNFVMDRSVIDYRLERQNLYSSNFRMTVTNVSLKLVIHI